MHPQDGTRILLHEKYNPHIGQVVITTMKDEPFKTKVGFCIGRGKLVIPLPFDIRWICQWYNLIPKPCFVLPKNPSHQA